MNREELPDHMMVVDDAGTPLSVVDVDKMQSDCIRLMYQYAASAGDDAELDRIAERWVAETDPNYFGYVAAGALSLMTRHVLDPLLQTVEKALPGVDFRAVLVEGRDNAEESL